MDLGYKRQTADSLPRRNQQFKLASLERDSIETTHCLCRFSLCDGRKVDPLLNELIAPFR